MGCPFLMNVLRVLYFFYIYKLFAKDISTFYQKSANVLSDKLKNIKKNIKRQGHSAKVASSRAQKSLRGQNGMDFEHRLGGAWPQPWSSEAAYGSISL